MKKCAPDDQADLLLRTEAQPPLISIAFTWTKAAVKKIDRDRYETLQVQGGSDSSSSAAIAPVAFVSGTEPAPAPAEVSSAASSESEEEHVPFAWMQNPVAGTGSTEANPKGLATPYDGAVWDLLEGKLDILQAETPAKTRDAIKKASEEASKVKISTSSSSAAVGSSSSQQPPEPITSVVQLPCGILHVDTSPWETDEKFKANLGLLASKLRERGEPPPVAPLVFENPGAPNPMEVDYTTD
jgi:hypothetical protein